MTAIISLLVAIVSAFIAVFAVYIPRRDNRDERILQQAILALERAYQSLTSDGKKVAPPSPDRLNWLTTARHIISYKSLKNRLKADFYKSLCEEHEEFWRHQFYLCLDMHKIHHAAYFEQGPPGMLPPIEPRSAIVIYSFASWPKNKIDPIDSVDASSLLNDSNVLPGNHGLSAYLEQFPHITGKT